MKKALILWTILSVLFLISFSFADDEIDKLQWKARALIAEYQLQQNKCPQLPKATDDLQGFINELSGKGYELKNGVVVKKGEVPAPAQAPKKK